MRMNSNLTNTMNHTDKFKFNKSEVIDFSDQLGTPLPGMSFDSHYELLRQYIHTPLMQFEKRRLLRALLSLDDEPYESDKEIERREAAEYICTINTINRS